MMVALLLSGFFTQKRWWIKVLGALHPAVGGAVDPDHPVRALHAESRMGHRQPGHFPAHRRRRPELAQHPSLALSFSILVHIWKSLPFWTLILIAGRLAIPGDLYEAASVDGATRRQQFRFVTWPSMQTLYLTCTILSMIWTLGDFNSVYLLTGGGPADLTHVLATLGIRYLRLDQVDLVDGDDRLRAAVRAPARLRHDEAALEMKCSARSARRQRRGKLLLIGIPVFLWTILPIYHLFLFAISPRESASLGNLWPTHPTLRNFEVVLRPKALTSSIHFWEQLGNSVMIAVAAGPSPSSSRPRRPSRSAGCGCAAAAP